jgi:hypothetical protein
MSKGSTSQGPAGVKFLFWRTSRGVAVAICLALFVTAIVCVAVVMEGVWDNRWLYLTGSVLACLSGLYMNAIRRADRFGG